MLGTAALAPASAPFRAWAGRPKGGGVDCDLFDDGNLGVPGGLEGDPERVLVIGAGMAGLTAARALRLAGVDATILEARDRIGGRMHTETISGAPVDMGASWIHGPQGNPVSQFIAGAGLAQIPAGVYDHILPKMSFFDAVEDRYLNLLELLGPGLAFLFFELLAPVLALDLGPETSLDEAVEFFHHRLGLFGRNRRYAKMFERSFNELEDSGALREIGLAAHAGVAELFPNARRGGFAAAGSGCAVPTGSTDDFPVGGYIRVLNAMAEGLDIRLEETALRVARVGDRVEVTTREKHGSLCVHSASHVLVT
ncbi:MAG: FAD-dependent oxidoreductase, partial [Myxococcales bacterium]|nr:FAD-dependent oxidoreductase [Myxococcales bacterium]